jgi:hypothetical protein
MNFEKVANDIWDSIHEPVTETMIRTGALTEERMESEGVAAGSTTYYQRRPSQRDQHKARGLADFHNKYIKDRILLSRALRRPGMNLLDMSVGQGGDLHKWVNGKVRFVLGCDVALTGLTDRANGAYRRYLDKQARSREHIPPMLFVQADSTKPYADGAAGLTPMDRSILRCLWGEHEEKAPPAAKDLQGVVARDGFDVASLMFTLHYFFQDVTSLNGWLRNLSDTVNVGGTFVGCCFDGDAVAAMLKDMAKGDVKRGVEGAADIWTIKKQYDDPDGFLIPTEVGLGRAIDVNFVSIGAAHTEYLVSFAYFQRRMSDIGFELLNEEELKTVGLRHSTNLFGDSYAMAEAEGFHYPMSPAIKEFSFLNRWFVFTRRRDGKAPRPKKSPYAGGGVEESKEAENSNTETNTARPDRLAAEIANAATLVAGAGTPATAELDLLTPEGAELPLREEEPAKAAEATATATATATVPAEPAKVKASHLFTFYHKSAAKDDFKRKDKHWRRVLSTFAPYDFRDTSNPEVVYPTLEAVIGAEKYKAATNRKELGPQIFGSMGTLHQEYAARLAALKTIEEMTPLLEAQGSAQREAHKAGAIKAAGAKWNPKAWDPVPVLADYLQQRVEKDEHFRRILKDVKAAEGTLVYVGGGELSAKVEGEEVKGDNLYGKALNALMEKL